MKHQVFKKMKQAFGVAALSLTLNSSFAAADSAQLNIDSSLVNGVNGNCKALRAQLLPAEADFREALCEYHQQSRPASVELVSARIELWQKLQNQGLDAPRQVMAALMEGLAHCQRARISQPLITKDVSERTAFCQAREAGFAALRSIRWEFAQFNYSADSGRDATDLIDEVAACQDSQGPLNPRFNDSCGIVDGLSAEREKAVVAESYDVLEKKYFGGVGPITRLLVEKKTMAEKVLEGMDVRVQTAEGTAAATAQAYAPARAYFDSQVVKDLNTIVEQYKWSYSTAKAILARYNEWQQGLLVDKDAQGNSVDLASVLAGSAPNSLVKQLEARHEAMSSYNGYAAVIKLVGERLQKLQALKDQNSKNARKMCAMFYCYLAVGPEVDSSYKRACNTPQLFSQQKNPLCENTKQKLVVDSTSQTAREFCASYSFDVNKYGSVGLSFEQVSSCEIK